MLRAGAVAPALELLKRMEQAHPQSPDVMRMLGVAHLQAGRPDLAEPFFRAVLQAKQGSAMAASDLAHVLMVLDRAEEALDTLLPQVPLMRKTDAGPDAATFHFNLGRAFKMLGRSSEAAQPLRQTLAFQPGHYAALVMLGDVEKALGKNETAAEYYRKAMQMRPNDGAAWWALSNLKTSDFTDTEFAELQKLAATVEGGEQKVFFDFALARGFEQRKDRDRAFACYRSGNLEKRRLEPWDRTGFSRWMASIRDSMGKMELPPRRRTLGHSRPVFLVSLPRSGSTLTEQVLAAHSQVTAAGELPWIPKIMAEESDSRRQKGQAAGLTHWATVLNEQEWRELGNRYLQHCRNWHQDTRVFTDKLPGNIPYVGVILAMLPDALIVNIRRDAMDVCWSCYRQLFISGAGFAYDLDDLAAYWKEHEQHMAFWREKAPDRILNLDYEALVQKPEEQIRRLLAFLELPFEPACLKSHETERAVNTPSAAQVREAINTRGIGHWRKYEGHLDGLMRAIEQDH